MKISAVLKFEGVMDRKHDDKPLGRIMAPMLKLEVIWAECNVSVKMILNQIYDMLNGRELNNYKRRNPGYKPLCWNSTYCSPCSQYGSNGRLPSGRGFVFWYTRTDWFWSLSFYEHYFVVLGHFNLKICCMLSIRRRNLQINFLG